MSCVGSIRVTVLLVCSRCFRKVISVGTLRAEYGRFEDRRQLCNSYDLFLADERILSRLPRLLGQKFFKTKK